jgi:hypothetical protein
MSAIGESFLAEEKREALNLVCQSQTFARSDTLKNLLRFVCEAEIAGQSDSLKEYVIGIEALGRPQGYSPTEDSSVRSRAYELRRKLEKFYATEANDASVRIEIPRGSYTPHFIRNSVIERPAAPLLPASVLQGTPAPILKGVRRIPVGLAIAFLAGVALTTGAMTAWTSRGQTPRSGGWTPDLEAIWKPMIDSKAPILVSFQTRLFVHVGPVNVRDWHIDNFAAVESSEVLMRIKQLLNVPQLYENRDYVDFGSANAVFQLSKLLATRKANIVAKRSTDVTWDDMKANNVIIIGKPEADPTVTRWLAKGKFMEVGGHIQNLHPAPGEPGEWVDHADPGNASKSWAGWAQKYALVTMIEGPGQGNWAMIMAGSGAEHPWALADYFTNPGYASELVKHLRLSSGKFPHTYQVVIRADFKSQVPVKVGYVTHRSLDTP